MRLPLLLASLVLAVAAAVAALAAAQEMRTCAVGPAAAEPHAPAAPGSPGLPVPAQAQQRHAALCQRAVGEFTATRGRLARTVPTPGELVGIDAR